MLESSVANSADIFGDVIYAYTRAQAIDDGVLVDVSEAAQKAGFRFPVAVTEAVWGDCVEWSQEDSKRQTYQDQAGRLWDVLWMGMCAARSAASRNKSQIPFSLYRVPRGGRGISPRLTHLKMAIGPGDNGEPVITIMMPNED
jgi:hypothetical protein